MAQDLSSVVFERVFPKLVQALADATAEDLSRVRHAALILLYRLLFVLYAEDRGLLPVNDPRYEDYGLRKPVRDHVAHRMQGGGVFSASASSYYDHLMTLFRQIDEGDESIGLPPYNGGLFASEAAPLLKTARLTDKIVGDIIYDLSHTETEGARHFVNYRDMSVQQLGSIYERLLEREPVRDDNGGIVVRPNSYARKDSGSFFTPQELVDLIVDRTLKPLAEERLKAFEDKSKELRSDHRAIAERHAELLALDPAEAVLDLKVLDPAMGSGHFLVTAVDFLSDYIAELAEYVPAVPEWLDGEYSSPLVERVAGHPGRNLDDTPEYFDHSLPLNQGPEPDYTPDEGDRVVHYDPGERPLCGNDAMTAVYTDEPAAVSGCRECLELVAKNLDDDNEYMGHCLHCRREITPRAGWSGGASSVRPPRTAGSQGGRRGREPTIRLITTGTDPIQAKRAWGVCKCALVQVCTAASMHMHKCTRAHPIRRGTHHIEVGYYQPVQGLPEPTGSRHRGQRRNRV